MLISEIKDKEVRMKLYDLFGKLCEIENNPFYNPNNDLNEIVKYIIKLEENKYSKLEIKDLKKRLKVIDEHDNIMRRENGNLCIKNTELKLENEKLKELLLKFMTNEKIEKELDNSLFFRKNYFIMGAGDTNGYYEEKIIECDNFD